MIPCPFTFLFVQESWPWLQRSVSRAPARGQIDGSDRWPRGAAISGGASHFISHEQEARSHVIRLR